MLPSLSWKMRLFSENTSRSSTQITALTDVDGHTNHNMTSVREEQEMPSNQCLLPSHKPACLDFVRLCKRILELLFVGRSQITGELWGDVVAGVPLPLTTSSKINSTTLLEHDHTCSPDLIANVNMARHQFQTLDVLDKGTFTKRCNYLTSKLETLALSAHENKSLLRIFVLFQSFLVNCWAY